MMFKVIPMLSKPLKHAKYNEILRNASKENDVFKKSWCFSIQKSKCAPKLIICMFLFLDVPDSKKIKKPLIQFRFTCF